VRPSRLHEFDAAVAAVREGLACVVPVPLFSLFTGFELETMVCGSPEIPIHLLKSVATYKVGQMICRYKDDGVTEWYEALLDWGTLAEDSSTKLKKGPANCVYYHTMYGVLFSPFG